MTQDHYYSDHPGHYVSPDQGLNPSLHGVQKACIRYKDILKLHICARLPLLQIKIVKLRGVHFVRILGSYWTQILQC